jgi:hypothetical protein
MRIKTAVIVCALVVSACDSGSKTSQTAGADSASGTGAPAAAAPATDSTGAAVTPAGAGTDGARFDPASVSPGRRVGDFMVVEAQLEQAAALPGKPYTGRVRFSGAIELTGKLVANPNPDRKTPCFEADAASAARLPRMMGDTRRAIICFQNNSRAEELTGSMQPPAPATVNIREFVSSYSFTDEVNSAFLVELYPGIGH